MESVIGAIYLDGGFASAKEFIHKFILKDIEHKKLFYDSKTILQEIVQSDYKGKEIEYVLTGEIGPDHDKKFVVSLVVGDKTLGEGTGRDQESRRAGSRLPCHYQTERKCLRHVFKEP